MKMSKKIRTLVSTALISAMVLTMGGMSAFAAETSNLVKQENGVVTITKTVTTDKDNPTYAPNTTFVFEVSNGIAGTVNDGANTAAVVYAGVTGGLKFAAENDAKAEFTPAMASSSDASYQSKDAKLTVDASVFEAPGIYHYNVKETAGNYAGITYDTTNYDVYLYVEFTYGENGVVSKKEVKNIVAKSGENKAGELAFTNDYGKDNGETHDVTITKEVKGNQGSKTKDFEFTISVVPDQSGETFQVVTMNGDKVQKSVQLTGDTSVKVSIKDGETIKVYGLTDGDKITVNESDYRNDGYTTTYTTSTSEKFVDNSYEVEKITGTNDEDSVSFKVAVDSAAITVTNTKTVSTPTGIVMTFGPYVLLIALAAVFGTLFFRRKREEF